MRPFKSACLAILCASPFFAQTPPAAAPQGRGPGRGALPFDYTNNEGWLSLFDGQTLNGWEGDMRFWQIKDGAIYIQPTCEKPTGTIYLVWQGGEPADFELKFDMKGTGNINGGMQFRSYLTSDPNVAFKYSGRGGGGTLVRPAPAPAAPGRAGAGRGPGATGRAPACANPGTPPTDVRAKYDLAGPQLDFDAANRYSAQFYEQSSGRGIIAPPGRVVMSEPGQPTRLLATLADKATLDSWFKKEDYNQFFMVAKGNTTSMFMNGHLISVFIDNDPAYFRAGGKLGIEVESTGELFTRNIFLKRL